jgi:hypothetical protein
VTMPEMFFGLRHHEFTCESLPVKLCHTAAHTLFLNQQMTSGLDQGPGPSNSDPLP